MSDSTSSPSWAAGLFTHVIEGARQLGRKLRWVALGALLLVMQWPLAQVDGLVREREARRDEARGEVATHFGTPQLVTGPVLTVPYRMLYPAILLFCAIGVYTVNNTSFDVMQTAFFGFLGVVFMKLECEPAPLLLGFVLGPMMEENLRRALLLSRGDPLVFVHRPISAGLLIAAALLVLVIGLPNIRKKREEAFQEAAT